MILDRARKIAFVHVPKTGGSAITAALTGDPICDDGAWQHLLHLKHRPHSGLVPFPEREEFFVFGFTRHPYDRAASFLRSLRMDSWPEFVAESTGALAYRLRAASDYLDGVDFAGRYERLEADWQHVCRVAGLGSLPLRRWNVSPNSGPKPILSDADLADIRARWADDFARWGYDAG